MATYGYVTKVFDELWIARNVSGKTIGQAPNLRAGELLIERALQVGTLLKWRRDKASSTERWIGFSGADPSLSSPAPAKKKAAAPAVMKAAVAAPAGAVAKTSSAKEKLLKMIGAGRAKRSQKEGAADPQKK
jgi:hypothetical protein